MDIGIIGYNLSRLVVVAAICVALFVHIIRKKGLFDYSEIKDVSWRDKAMRHARTINAVAILINGALLVAVLSIAVPIAKDVPYMIQGAYLTAEGTVVSNSMGGAVDRIQERDFTIKDEATGTEILVHALSTGIEKGEYAKVTYWPNSGLATINEHR